MTIAGRAPPVHAVWRHGDTARQRTTFAVDLVSTYPGFAELLLDLVVLPVAHHQHVIKCAYLCTYPHEKSFSCQTSQLMLTNCNLPHLMCLSKQSRHCILS